MLLSSFQGAELSQWLGIGSSKSTTARVIAGLLPPSKGSVLVRGQALPTRMDSEVAISCAASR